MSTFTLPSGYDRHKVRATVTLRPLTGADLRDMTHGTLWCECLDGCARNVRFSGRAKTWKTRPNVERPIKFGLYESATAVADSPDAPAYVWGSNLRLGIEVDA